MLLKSKMRFIDDFMYYRTKYLHADINIWSLHTSKTRLTAAGSTNITPARRHGGGGGGGEADHPAKKGGWGAEAGGR